MKNTSGPTLITSPEYRQFIEDMKARVISARISAARYLVFRDHTIYHKLSYELKAAYSW